MIKEAKQNILILQGFYLCVFFGLGGISTLISVYLSKIEGLNGYQIGTIMSIGPIIMIFFQPFWGIISDLTKAPIKVLTITTFLAGFLGLGYIVFDEYYWFLIIALLVAIFQSAIVPISDSISIQYTAKARYNYGNIRLFGSLGFGIAVFLLGRISEVQPKAIFYSFFLFLSLASILGSRFPRMKTNAPKNLFSGVKEIFLLKKYLIFLVITFLIFGPNLANNTYFGLFIEARGGTFTGIGIAFLLAVLSEIPFMRAAGSLMKRIGLLQVCAIAGMVSLARWTLYFFEPSLSIVYGTAVLQGFSIGLFIPSGLQYIQSIVPSHVVVTGITFYSAIGNGLGNWFSTFMGGVIYEEFSIYTVYLFFGILSVIGVLLSIWLIKVEKEMRKALAV